MHRKGFSGRYFFTRNDFSFSPPVASFLRAGSGVKEFDEVGNGGGAGGYVREAAVGGGRIGGIGMGGGGGRPCPAVEA